MDADEQYDDVEEDFEDDAEHEIEEEEEVETADSQWKKILDKHHPECRIDYIEDILEKLPLTVINGLDINHKSPPFLTIYERTKIIGLRATQIANGATPYIPVPSHVSNVEEIATMELDQRRLPFIVKRPMPDGSYEYWRLGDLMIL